ncbi:MAG: hypothetical protein M1586_02750 [Patescibacteria group bacterium]|nr:hypothetical protein [Patescibacteria group bacterium]MCL5262189.1 hypothetical protein [Patescibacteria group bacterium]
MNIVSKREGDIVITSKEKHDDPGIADLMLGVLTGGLFLTIPDPKYEAEALEIKSNTHGKGYGNTREEAEMNAAKDLAKELEKRQP